MVEQNKWWVNKMDGEYWLNTICGFYQHGDECTWNRNKKKIQRMNVMTMAWAEIKGIPLHINEKIRFELKQNTSQRDRSKTESIRFWIKHARIYQSNAKFELSQIWWKLLVKNASHSQNANVIWTLAEFFQALIKSWQWWQKSELLFQKQKTARQICHGKSSAITKQWNWIQWWRSRTRPTHTRLTIIIIKQVESGFYCVNNGIKLNLFAFQKITIHQKYWLGGHSCVVCGTQMH